MNVNKQLEHLVLPALDDVETLAIQNGLNPFDLSWKYFKGSLMEFYLLRNNQHNAGTVILDYMFKEIRIYDHKGKNTKTYRVQQ